MWGLCRAGMRIMGVKVEGIGDVGVRALGLGIRV